MTKCSDFTPYDLGIVWGLGCYSHGKIVFRHQDKYFIDRMKLYFPNVDYRQKTNKNKIQNVLKSAYIDIQSFIDAGWMTRNADIRDVPLLENYTDFLRGYVELHGCFKYVLRYRRKPRKNPYRTLAFIIYGNYNMLSSLNTILADVADVRLKKVQLLHNGKTASLNYTSYMEIYAILQGLYGEPNNPKYWDNAFYRLRNPTQEI